MTLDDLVYDLVRCLKWGGGGHDFGHRVYTAAEKRGLILWDEGKGKFVVVEATSPVEIKISLILKYRAETDPAVRACILSELQHPSLVNVEVSV